MSGLFGSSSPGIAPAVPSPLPTPKATRMPVETDPSIVSAAQRTRKAALARKGRLSTILTDQTRETVGSSGQTLGA